MRRTKSNGVGSPNAYGIVALMCLISLVYFPANKKSEMIKLTGEQATAASDLLAYGLGVALNGDNFAAISEGYETAKGMKAVSYILIYDVDKNLLSSYNPDSVVVPPSVTQFDTVPVEKKGYICGPHIKIGA